MSNPASQGNGRKLMIIVGVGGNLLLLGYFKYANFFMLNFNSVFDQSFTMERIFLPLGISFFTFTQISFIVDCYRGATYGGFLRYLFFVSFFPHLVAGPILNYREIAPQLDDNRFARQLDWGNISAGLTLFTIGLFKKVALADGIATYTNQVFLHAAANEHCSFLPAWCGALGYSLQLYFDFSAYSNMAIGLAQMFGVSFPLNFNSPYRSLSIIDFWRRWHMTLAIFLREYLYIPLGGNRRGEARRYANLMIVMLLAGLWHGAGWNFIIWGGLHGLYLAVNNLWRKRCVNLALLMSRSGFIATGLSWLLTFTSVVVAWVFFRTNSVAEAMNIINGMTGANGVWLPDSYGAFLGPIGGVLGRAGVDFVKTDPVIVAKISHFLCWIAGLLAVALLAPAPEHFMRGGGTCIVPDMERTSGPFGFARWKPSWTTAIVLAALATYSLRLLAHPSLFLYFQF